jgi:hypothetical protein
VSSDLVVIEYHVNVKAIKDYLKAQVWSASSRRPGTWSVTSQLTSQPESLDTVL